MSDLTTELTLMLGDPDPAVREGLAYLTLRTWLNRGVYDHLLVGLGDGMAVGLTAGFGRRTPVENGQAVFRRALSARVLADCINRDTLRPLVHAGKVLDWGDRIATWLIRESDLRGYVPGQGMVCAVGHGADSLAVLARSPHLAVPELTVLLDVIGDRVLKDIGHLFANGEPDRLARATLQVLGRDRLPLRIVEPWVGRIAAGANQVGSYGSDGPPLTRGNAEMFLRSLYLQLELGPERPDIRADLLLILVEALRAGNPNFLRPPLDLGHSPLS